MSWGFNLAVDRLSRQKAMKLGLATQHRLNLLQAFALYKRQAASTQGACLALGVSPASIAGSTAWRGAGVSDPVPENPSGCANRLEPRACRTDGAFRRTYLTWGKAKLIPLLKQRGFRVSEKHCGPGVLPGLSGPQGRAGTGGSERARGGHSQQDRLAASFASADGTAGNAGFVLSATTLHDASIEGIYWRTLMPADGSPCSGKR